MQPPMHFAAAPSSLVRWASTSSSSAPSSMPVIPKYKSVHQERPGGPAKNLLASLRGSSCGEDTGPLPPRDLTPLQKRQLLMRNKATFTLTPQAVRRIKFLLEKWRENPENKGLAAPDGIRIGVRRRGCSGYSYTVNYHFSELAAASPAKKNPLMADSVVEQDGLKVVVAGDALFYVIGTHMDYVVLNVEEKFVFKNPNKKFSCGCEESFMPYDQEDLDEGA